MAHEQPVQNSLKPGRWVNSSCKMCLHSCNTRVHITEDGIVNKIDPGPAMDKDLYDLPPRELKKIPTVCGSLREALESLKKDNAFLKAGGVFNDDFIESYIELKMQDVARFEMTPHPVEFAMYYSY